MTDSAEQQDGGGRRARCAAGSLWTKGCGTLRADGSERSSDRNVTPAQTALPTWRAHQRDHGADDVAGDYTKGRRGKNMSMSNRIRLSEFRFTFLYMPHALEE